MLSDSLFAAFSPRVFPQSGEIPRCERFQALLVGSENKLTSGPLWRTRHESNMHSTRSKMFEKSSNMFSSVLSSTRAFCEMSVLKKCFRPLSGRWKCLVKAFCLLWRFFGRHYCKLYVKSLLTVSLYAPLLLSFVS